MQHVVPIKRSPRAAEFKEEKQQSPSKHQTLGLPPVDDNFKRRRRHVGDDVVAADAKPVL